MRHRRCSAILLAVVTATAGLMAPAGAAESSRDNPRDNSRDNPSVQKHRVDREVAELHDDLDESTSAMRSAVASYEEATAALPGARQAVAEAQGLVAAAQARDSAARDALEAAQAAERVAARRVRAAYGAVQSTERAVGDVARVAYQQGPIGGLAIALEAETPQDFSTGLSTMESVLTSENATLDRLRDRRAELALRKAQLQVARQRAVDQREEAASQLTRTQEAEQAAEAASQRVEALVAQRSAAVRAAEAARADDLRRYRTMQAEQERLARVIKARAAAAARRAAAKAAREKAAREKAAREQAAREQAAREQAARDKAAREQAAREQAAARSAEQANAAPVPVAPRHRRRAVASRLFSYPVAGPITSGFGYRFHPVLRYRKLHTGVDFGVAEGTPVRASRGGRVIEAGYNSAYGYRTVIDHGYVRGQYLVSTYNHQSRLAVQAGQYVSQGQVIGYSGNTGFSTGPHLHFEILVNGAFVDPMGWL